MKRGTAIGYVRTAVQDSSGEKILRQREDIAAYCNKHTLYLARVFEDNGANDSNFNRQGWSDLEDFLIDTNNSISYLVVADLDRIGRTFSKVDQEISMLKGDYRICILPVRRRMGLNSALQKGIQKKKRGKRP